MSDATMPTWARVWAARVIAAVVGGFVRWLGVRWDVSMSPAEQAAVESVAFAVALAVYGVAHKILNKWINPGDAASSHLAVQEKAEAAEIKAAPAAAPPASAAPAPLTAEGIAWAVVAALRLAGVTAAAPVPPPVEDRGEGPESPEEMAPPPPLRSRLAKRAAAAEPPPREPSPNDAVEGVL